MKAPGSGEYGSSQPPPKWPGFGGPGLALLCSVALGLAGCAGRPTPPPPAAVADAERLAREAARLLSQENWAGAAVWWQRAGRQYQLVNLPDQVALARHNEALARRALGEPVRASELLEDAARLNRLAGQTNAWWRNQIALFQLELDADPARAAARHANLEPRLGELADQPALAGHWYHETARLRLARGDTDGVIEPALGAAVRLETAGDRAGAAAAWLTVARAQEAAGHPSEATSAWRIALERFEALGHARGIATALAGLGRRLLAEDTAEPGKELLARARDNFRALRMEREALAVEELLKDPPPRPGAGAGPQK